MTKSAWTGAHNLATEGVHGIQGDVVGTTDVQELTNKTLTGATILGGTLANVTLEGVNTGVLTDATTTIVDDVDPTKVLKFQISGVTTGTTRTLTVPDANDTIVGLAATQTLTNKTLTAPALTTPRVTTGIFDSTGGTLIAIGSKASPVNHIELTQGATGEPVTVAAIGANTDIDLVLAGKGTGVPKIGSAAITTATNAQTLTNKTVTRPRIVTSIDDANGNEVIITPATSSAVNEVTITNAAAAGIVTISASGGDADVQLNITSKGGDPVLINTCEISAAGRIMSVQIHDAAPSTAAVTDAPTKAVLDALIVSLITAGILE